MRFGLVESLDYIESLEKQCSNHQSTDAADDPHLYCLPSTAERFAQQGFGIW